jgi:hypothetical protein
MKRLWLQGVAALLLSCVGLVVAVQPANAASVTVPPGKSGSACSAYQEIGDFHQMYWQDCAWASGGSEPRVWFTAHFGNRTDQGLYIFGINIGYAKSGKTYRRCYVQTDLYVPAHSVVASSDACQFPRAKAAYQAVVSIQYDAGPYKPDVLSPTLQVQ